MAQLDGSQRSPGLIFLVGSLNPHLGLAEVLVNRMLAPVLLGMESKSMGIVQKVNGN